jgi:hypothetical protein
MEQNQNHLLSPARRTLVASRLQPAEAQLLPPKLRLSGVAKAIFALRKHTSRREGAVGFQADFQGIPLLNIYNSTEYLRMNRQTP